VQRFIVGTGRCGSTMLSRMLQEHPDTLSILEFFSTLDRASVFQPGEFDGPEVCAILARTNLLNDLVVSREPFFQEGVAHSYRREASGAGYRLPGFMLVLHQLSPEPAPLYAEAMAEVGARPRRPLAEHWLALFDWMTLRLGKRGWLERSGVSIEYVGELIDRYPYAKYVHIHRDGVEAALSSRGFRHFVLYCSLFSDPPGEAELREMLAEEIDPATDPVVRRMTNQQPPIDAYGRYWSWQIARGYHELVRLAPEQRLDVRYEDLVSEPAVTLERIADFFELPRRDGWIARAAGMVDPEGAAPRQDALDADELARLRIACRPGETLLGRDLTNGFADTMHGLRRVVG